MQQHRQRHSSKSLEKVGLRLKGLVQSANEPGGQGQSSTIWRCQQKTLAFLGPKNAQIVRYENKFPFLLAKNDLGDAWCCSKIEDLGVSWAIGEWMLSSSSMQKDVKCIAGGLQIFGR